MMQMQRSLSLPGPAHASPPVSPTITHVSSRSPTPSPPENSVVPPRIHRYQSRSPHRPPTAYKEPPAESERPRSVTRQISPSPASRRKDADSQSISSQTIAQESPATPTKPPPKPLLQDISQYITPQISAITTANSTTTLEELAHVVRLSTYQERKRTHSRIRLQRSLVSTALSARLTRCGELAHRTLVDNFRADEKKSFASLYNAIYDVRDSCDATRRYALLEPEFDNNPSNPNSAKENLSTFMHEIPQRSRESLLKFLTQIRTNPDYLASRICSLSATELTALTTFHQGLEAVNSTLPFHNRSKGHVSGNNRTSAHIPTPVERLLSFQRHDPLSALIHTCFANSAGPDSLEDLRRTEVFAATCARLISEQKTGTEPFICNVLNAWTAMRDWSGRSNMEWYLMKILEDGAFLLEKAEDPAGTRIHVGPRSAKDSIAAEEFYSAAVDGLFEIIDDPGAGGIPEGLLELGNAMLRKLDSKLHHTTKRFFVSKWLFSVFLLNVMIHPEYYGMMSEYHITEYGRQKILKEVIMRAQKLVGDMLWRDTVSTPLGIKHHVDNIMGRFRTNRPSRSKAKLLPARSITSLRETAEVRPYLVLGPADLTTLVNALFPEKRPVSSSIGKDSGIGLRSSASSISGLSTITQSMPIPSPRSTFDTMSIMSTSASSVVSDTTTSREPLLDDLPKVRRTHYEDDGFELRVALFEMTQTLGIDGISGSCHPCAERWSVLFMSPDGQTLSTQMGHDPDEDGDEEEFTTSSDSDNESPGSQPDLNKDYHQLRDSILKLVEEYEIPHSRVEPKTFSNRTSALESPRKQQPRSRPGSLVQPVSKNPYRLRESSLAKGKDVKVTETKLTTRQRHDSDSDRQSLSDKEPVPVLISMLEAAEAQCQAQSDFVNAHLYWKTLNQLHQISSPSLKRDGFASLLSIFSRGPRDSIRRSTSAIEEYDAWLVWLKQSQERHDVTIESMMKRLKALRDKMWYVTDVRNSAAYEGARNISIALKCMAAPKKSNHPPHASARTRNVSKPTPNNFLLKTEAQVMDMMAAVDEQGGPNKLSDEQSDKTARWLAQFSIENFCPGEERIHRFSLEMETAIRKLVGDNLMDGPVLWSSELYSRDKRILDSGRQKGDLFLHGLGSLNLSGDDNESVTERRGVRGTDFHRPGFRDLRAMSARNSSQQSFDSGRFSMSRMSTTGDLMDSQDYFGVASPVLTIDSSTTFWSPFQTRAQSPTTSISSHRPGTSSSTNETITMKEERASQAKQQFLSNLKQTLTSLLISDLGTLVFARGSETDAWFSGELGQDCIERKDRAEQKVRRRKDRKRTLEKKKSVRDLRAHRSDSHSQEGSDNLTPQQMERGPSATSRSTEYSTPETRSATGSSASDYITPSLRKSASRDSDSPDFPYRRAFKRLLRMFSVHPNPYQKLNALFELEHLIIAFLTPSGPRRPRIRPESLTVAPTPQSPEVQHINAFGDTGTTGTTPRAKNLEEAIDNCKERRSQTFASASSPDPSSPVYQRSQASSVPASTDMIVDVLQDLFRDPDIRPKTLFRDLQFIASFVPASVLDKTERGKAFWDAGLAALGLKQDVCKTLIEVADEIQVYYTQTRKIPSHQPASSSAPGSGSGNTAPTTQAQTHLTPSGEVMKYSMEDAARMWTITAKEGDPVAERELAIFYLTHPDLVERVTAPLSKPSLTFKTMVGEGAGKGWVGGRGGGGFGGEKEERDRDRSDPATMCFAYHWMGLSALGGDELAKKYLRQREELNAIP